MKPIRLNQHEIDAIKETFRLNFSGTDRLWVFGSRADLSRKGGDIDLYIETDIDDPAKVIEAKLQFLIDLKNKIGDQKIDVVIRFQNEERLIFSVAKEEGVQLI